MSDLFRYGWLVGGEGGKGFFGLVLGFDMVFYCVLV